MTKYCIVGLPGSGKTYLGMKLSTITGLPYHDDITPETILEEDCIVSSPYFTREEVRDIFRHSNPKCHFIYFSNSPAQCLINSVHRGNRDVESDIKQMSRIYNPPSNSLPVYGEHYGL